MPSRVSPAASKRRGRPQRSRILAMLARLFCESNKLRSATSPETADACSVWSPMQATCSRLLPLLDPLSTRGPRGVGAGVPALAARALPPPPDPVRSPGHDSGAAHEARIEPLGASARYFEAKDAGLGEIFVRVAREIEIVAVRAQSRVRADQAAAENAAEPHQPLALTARHRHG